jgi:Acyl-CoA dehydrogenase, C-terminal domain
MRFALTDEQRQFAATLHEALGRSATWQNLGLTKLLESGAGPVDLVVAFDELGHHAVPGPTIESIAVVPTLGVGDCVASLSFPPHVPYALDADSAELVLTVIEDSVWAAEPVGPALSSVDSSRRLFETKPVRELASGVDTARAFNLGALACAAESLGAARALLELTVEYAKQRKQFGRPIGGFQAVKHQLADVVVGLELARPLLYGAAITGVARDISAAKVAATLAADRAATTALQVHGAIGYTQEYALVRFLTRIRALRAAWGTLSIHRAAVLGPPNPVGGRCAPAATPASTPRSSP